MCACEALATLRPTCLYSFFSDPENVRNLSSGEIWNFIKGSGLPRFGHRFKGNKGPVIKVYVHRDGRAVTHLLFHYILFMRKQTSQQVGLQHFTLNDVGNKVPVAEMTAGSRVYG